MHFVRREGRFKQWRLKQKQTNKLGRFVIFENSLQMTDNLMPVKKDEILVFQVLPFIIHNLFLDKKKIYLYHSFVR